MITRLHTHNQKHKKSPNPLRVDPTRSATLRRKFQADLRRRFRKLKKAIIDLVDTEDAFGIKPRKVSPFIDQGKPTENVGHVPNRRFEAKRSDEQIKLFRAFVEDEFGKLVLDADQEDSEELYLRKFAEEGYKKGAARAFDDTRKPRQDENFDFFSGTKEEFLRQSFGSPVATSRLRVLTSRVFTDLKGVGQAMSTQMGRVLADGLARGDGAKVIARDLTARLDIGRKRAETIARTECLPGDTLVDSAMVRAVFRRWYEGPMVEVTTRSGRKFSATPNHPMLTTRGWVSANDIRNGDHLIGNRRQQDLSSAGNANVNRGPTKISEIFDSLNAVGVIERKATGEPDFHGDGSEGYVDILCPDGELHIGDFSSLNQPLMDNIFSPSDSSGSGFCPFCSRLLPVNQRACLCRASESDIIVKQSSLYATSVYSHGDSDGCDGFSRSVTLDDFGNVNVGSVLVPDSPVFPCSELGLGISPSDACLPKDFADLLLIRSYFDSDLPLSETSQVEIDDVLSVRIIPFSGHVYNLETPFGYFTIDSLYTGNTVRAHAEGQLDSLEQMGVTEVGVAVEWSTAGDNRVCRLCRPMEGVVFKVKESHGLIPRHSNCRCAWIPANVGEDQTGQKRTKAQKQAAIDQSIKAEAPKGTSLEEQKKVSRSKLADVKPEAAPKSIFDE